MVHSCQATRTSQEIGTWPNFISSIKYNLEEAFWIRLCVVPHQHFGLHSVSHHANDWVDIALDHLDDGWWNVIQTIDTKTTTQSTWSNLKSSTKYELEKPSWIRLCLLFPSTIWIPLCQPSSKWLSRDNTPSFGEWSNGDQWC